MGFWNSIVRIFAAGTTAASGNRPGLELNLPNQPAWDKLADQISEFSEEYAKQRQEQKANLDKIAQEAAKLSKGSGKYQINISQSRAPYIDPKHLNTPKIDTSKIKVDAPKIDMSKIDIPKFNFKK